jgi:hypothetical protein
MRADSRLCPQGRGEGRAREGGEEEMSVSARTRRVGVDARLRPCGHAHVRVDS